MNIDNEISHDSGGPVTFIIRRRIREGCHADFEEWSRGIAEECKHFEGYLGIRVIYPGNQQEEYVTILSFDEYANFLAWENSPERKSWLKKVGTMTEGETTREIVRGFDYWLGSESESSRSWPPAFRMILLAFVAI